MVGLAVSGGVRPLERSDQLGDPALSNLQGFCFVDFSHAFSLEPERQPVKGGFGFGGGVQSLSEV